MSQLGSWCESTARQDDENPRGWLDCTGFWNDIISNSQQPFSNTMLMLMHLIFNTIRICIGK